MPPLRPIWFEKFDKRDNLWLVWWNIYYGEQCKLTRGWITQQCRYNPVRKDHLGFFSDSNAPHGSQSYIVLQRWPIVIRVAKHKLRGTVWTNTRVNTTSRQRLIMADQAPYYTGWHLIIDHIDYSDNNNPSPRNLSVWHGDQLWLV